MSPGPSPGPPRSSMRLLLIECADRWADSDATVLCVVGFLPGSRRRTGCCCQGTGPSGRGCRGRALTSRNTGYRRRDGAARLLPAGTAPSGLRSDGAGRSGGATDRRPLPARSRTTARRSRPCQDSPGDIVDACGPKSPDSHRVVWGLTARPLVSLRAFLRFPVCPLSSSPSPAFLWFPFVRRSPVCSLRPSLPGSGSPSVSLRVPFPLSNLHVSAAPRRLGRR